jgi:hypothetical protein
MDRVCRKASCLFALLLSMTVYAVAQEQPDFSGRRAQAPPDFAVRFEFGVCTTDVLDTFKNVFVRGNDLAAAIALIKELGYAGLYSIENEQPGDPYDNVQKVYDVVVANI